MSDTRKIFSAVFLTMALVAGAGYLTTKSSEPLVAPEELLETRKSLVDTGVLITARMNQALDHIAEIDSYQRAGDIGNAAKIVATEIQTDVDRTEIALAFSEDLGKMALIIEEISPFAAQQKILVIAEQGTALVRNLLEYNNQLRDLFVTLQVYFNTGQEVDDFIAQRVDLLNQEADIVNSANDEFNRLWREFDSEF